MYIATGYRSDLGLTRWKTARASSACPAMSFRLSPRDAGVVGGGEVGPILLDELGPLHEPVEHRGRASSSAYRFNAACRPTTAASAAAGLAFFALPASSRAILPAMSRHSFSLPLLNSSRARRLDLGRCRCSRGASPCRLALCRPSWPQARQRHAVPLQGLVPIVSGHAVVAHGHGLVERIGIDLPRADLRLGRPPPSVRATGAGPRPIRAANRDHVVEDSYGFAVEPGPFRSRTLCRPGRQRLGHFQTNGLVALGLPETGRGVGFEPCRGLGLELRRFALGEDQQTEILRPGRYFSSSPAVWLASPGSGALASTSS